MLCKSDVVPPPFGPCCCRHSKVHHTAFDYSAQLKPDPDLREILCRSVLGPKHAAEVQVGQYLSLGSFLAISWQH
jgi:hypothetical protein